MKTYSPIRFISITACFCVITLSTINGQSVKCEETVAAIQNEPVSELSIITEQDYTNLLSLSGLKKYSNVRYDININEKGEYKLDGKGKNASLYAVYDKDGNLIRASYITKNTLLPRTIYRHLATDNYLDWTMTSNKKVVTNFDASSTKYEVELKKGKVKQILNFDNAGNLLSS